MQSLSRWLLRAILFSGGAVAGAYCVRSAFQNGAAIAGGLDGTAFGMAFGAAVIVSWFMLPWADRLSAVGKYRDAWAWRSGWLLVLAFVLSNAITFAASHRTDAVEDNGAAIARYEGALASKERATGELAALKRNARWERTSGCSNATADPSIALCGAVRAAQSRIDAADAILSHGRPGARDAGAETLGWVLGQNAAAVARAMPVLWAVTLELVASLCMMGAFLELKAEASSPLPAAAPEVRALPSPEVSAGVEEEAPATPRQILDRVAKVVANTPGRCIWGQNKAAELAGVPKSSLSDAILKALELDPESLPFFIQKNGIRNVLTLRPDEWQST